MLFNSTIKSYSSLDSTNEEAKRQVFENNLILKKEDLLAIIADYQISGKGRLDRFWQSEKGNLYCSLVINPIHSIKRWSEISFVIAVSIGEVINNLIPKNLKVQYKWPNDILLESKKISGILLETCLHEEKKYLIIGCGVNILKYPIGLEYQATSLSQYNIDCTSKEILKKLIESFDKYYSMWEKGNFKDIISLWLSLAKDVGKNILVKINEERSIHGVFEGIESNGFLKLRKANNEIELISVGDVFYI